MVPQIPLWVPDNKDYFILRPKYSMEQLDAVCEDAISDILYRRHGKVDPPVTDDDLIVLLESSGVEVELDADFSKELGWVQGKTEFRTDKATRVSIAKSLSEIKSCGNRFRFTLGHEWGHVVLLREAYLREGNVRKEGSWRHVCNPDMARHKSEHNWAEWQADHCGGALLIPRRLLELRIDLGLPG
jgi:hypothetical protein